MADLDLSLEKLSPKPGDVVVIRLPKGTPHYGELISSMHFLVDKLPPGVSAIVAQEGVSLEVVSEEQMLELGWVRA